MSHTLRTSAKVAKMRRLDWTNGYAWGVKGKPKPKAKSIAWDEGYQTGFARYRAIEAAGRSLLDAAEERAAP
jgi:hypothetical protein